MSGFLNKHTFHSQTLRYRDHRVTSRVFHSVTKGMALHLFRIYLFLMFYVRNKDIIISLVLSMLIRIEDKQKNKGPSKVIGVKIWTYVFLLKSFWKVFWERTGITFRLDDVFYSHKIRRMFKTQEHTLIFFWSLHPVHTQWTEFIWNIQNYSYCVITKS